MNSKCFTTGFGRKSVCSAYKVKNLTTSFPTSFRSFSHFNIRQLHSNQLIFKNFTIVIPYNKNILKNFLMFLIWCLYVILAKCFLHFEKPGNIGDFTFSSRLSLECSRVRKICFLNIFFTIAFSQSIKWNMRNIFLEKSYTKCGGKTSPRPFSEKSKLSISLTQWSKFLYSLFLLYAKLRAIEIHLN